MNITSILSFCTDFRFVLLVLLGSVLGLFIGAIPGLSVTMATALLVSVTYSWTTSDAMATIMGLYVVGVFSGALSAILINIPGAPSSVVTAFDGYPMSRRGEAKKALKYATIYSFVGSVFGFIALWFLSGPISSIAIKFHPIDYFLLSFFGLLAVGSLQLGQVLENIPFELDAVQTGDGGGGAELDLLIANGYGFLQHNQATSSSGT